MANNDTPHYFHAEAHALTGKLIRPFDEQIKKQAFVKLEGYLADLVKDETAQRNYFSENAEEFRLEGIISYSGAHTQVSGFESEKHKVNGKPASVTLATSVVEDLNVLNVVTADRVVAQISTTHFPGEYSPHVTFLGTHFENLRIARHKAEPYLRLDLAGARGKGKDAMPVDQGTDLMKAVEAQYKNIKAKIEALAEDARKKMRFTDADEWLANKYHGLNLKYDAIRNDAKDAKEKDREWNGVTCSLVENVEIKEISAKDANGNSNPIKPPAKTFGHVIHIPDFGNVFLAELTVKHNSYHLTMIRLDMGCMASGGAGVGTCNVNGGTKPPPTP